MPPQWKPWITPDPLNRGSCDPHRVYPGSQLPRENSQNVMPVRSQPAAVKVYPKHLLPDSPRKDSALGTSATSPPTSTTNLVSGSKESAFPLAAADLSPGATFSSTLQALVRAAKRKSDENLEDVPKNVEPVSRVEGNSNSAPAVDETVLIVSQNNGETTSTLNNIKSASPIIQNKVRDAQRTFSRLVALANGAAVNHAANGEELASTSENELKDSSSVAQAPPKRTKRHIEFFEHSLSIQRPRGTWKEWDDDSKINAARWFGAHPEDLTPETLAKWEMPGDEMWPFFAEGAWQMPSIHVEYRLRPVRFGVDENVVQTVSEDTGGLAEVIPSGETSAEGASG